MVVQVGGEGGAEGWGVRAARHLFLVEHAAVVGVGKLERLEHGAVLAL